MNRLKMISVALVCALGLSMTACVDDDESKSVENIRNAKASLLEAKAALEKANAEAVLLQANADAALTNAEAAFQKAQAEKEQAAADIAKATLEMDIEAAKLTAQATLDQAKATQLSSANAYVQQLYTLYDGAVGQIFSLTVDKIDAQKSVLSAKYRLENFEVLVASQVNRFNLNIAQSEALIAEYEKLKGKDAEALNQAIIAANAEEGRITKEVNIADKNSKLAEVEETNAYTALENTDYAKAAELFENYDLATTTVIREGNYQAKATGKAGDNTEFTENGTSLVYIESVDQNEIAKYLVEQKALLKAAEEAFVDVDTNYKKLIAAEDKAYHTYDTAKTNKDSYKAAYETARTAAANYRQTSDYDTKQTTVSDMQEDLDAMIAAQKVLADYAANYQPALDAAKAKSQAYAQAQVEKAVKDQDLSVATALVGSLGNIVVGNLSVEDLIAQEKANIQNYKNQLASISLSDGSGNNYTEEQWAQLVATLEKQVASLEAQIARYQADADRYKALLEAAAEQE